MASFSSELELCPFSTPSFPHVLHKDRFQRHLRKCSKNFIRDGLGICRFNRSHVVPEDQLVEHHKRCPDKALVEQVILGENVSGKGYLHQGRTDRPDYTALPEEWLTSKESWQTDPDQPSYSFINRKKKWGIFHESFSEPFLPYFEEQDEVRSPYSISMVAKANAIPFNLGYCQVDMKILDNDNGPVSAWSNNNSLQNEDMYWPGYSRAVEDTWEADPHQPAFNFMERKKHGSKLPKSLSVPLFPNKPKEVIEESEEEHQIEYCQEDPIKVAEQMPKKDIILNGNTRRVNVKFFDIVAASNPILDQHADVYRRSPTIFNTSQNTPLMGIGRGKGALTKDPPKPAAIQPTEATGACKPCNTNFFGIGRGCKSTKTENSTRTVGTLTGCKGTKTEHLADTPMKEMLLQQFSITNMAIGIGRGVVRNNSKTNVV